MTAPWIARQLRELVTQPGHAWLLQGASGLGQYDLGLALAKSWLCEAAGSQGACNTCASCHAVDVRTHADLEVLMPETDLIALGWPLGEKAEKEIEDKNRKASREIRVESMRDAVEFTQRTDARGRGKVVLVYPAEQMNHITANTLLKTLEEPPGSARFILASEAAQMLLPTIRSRCLTHAMQWPQPEEALAWLREQGVPAGADAALLRAAGGRPQGAMRLHQAGRDPAAWAALPRLAARGDVRALEGFSPPQAVEALQKLCHDMLAVTCNASPRFFELGDLPKPSSLSALSEWSRDLMREARTADHPFNAGLMLESLVSRARGALHSGGS